MDHTIDEVGYTKNICVDCLYYNDEAYALLSAMLLNELSHVAQNIRCRDTHKYTHTHAHIQIGSLQLHIIPPVVVLFITSVYILADNLGIE